MTIRRRLVGVGLTVGGMMLLGLGPVYGVAGPAGTADTQLVGDTASTVAETDVAPGTERVITADALDGDGCGPDGIPCLPDPTCDTVPELCEEEPPPTCDTDPSLCEPEPPTCETDPSLCEPEPPTCETDPSLCEEPEPVDPCVIDPASCTPQEPGDGDNGGDNGGGSGDDNGGQNGGGHSGGNGGGHNGGGNGGGHNGGGGVDAGQGSYDGGAQAEGTVPGVSPTSMQQDVVGCTDPALCSNVVLGESSTTSAAPSTAPSSGRNRALPEAGSSSSDLPLTLAGGAMLLVGAYLVRRRPRLGGVHRA